MSLPAAAAMTTAAPGGAGVPHLLHDLRPDAVMPAPYAHFTRRDMVPAETYAVLEAHFPSLDMILNGRAPENNQAVRMTVKQVVNDRRIAPIWREFFEYHTSADYWRDVVRLFGTHFRREFPGLEERIGRRYEDWRIVPRGFRSEERRVGE